MQGVKARSPRLTVRPSACHPGNFGHLLSLVLKMRFPPSVVETKHGWRTAMHLEGRNEVENRNGACVMEVASLGSRAKIGAKEGERKSSARVSFRSGSKYTKALRMITEVGANARWLGRPEVVN